MADECYEVSIEATPINDLDLSLLTWEFNCLISRSELFRQDIHDQEGSISQPRALVYSFSACRNFSEPCSFVHPDTNFV